MIRQFCGRLAATSLAFAITAAIGQEKPATFSTNEQLRHYKAMADARLSPDGKQVLLRLRDATADGAKSHLWLLPVDGSPARQLTFSPDADKGGEHAGEWMPDGQSILFLAHRGEHTLLYRLPMNGGEAKVFDLKTTPLVDESKLPGALPIEKPEAGKPEAGKDAAKEDKPEPTAIDVENFRISPDGKTIALIANDPETPGEKKQKEAKADAAWVDHKLHGSRLYLLDVASNKLTVAGLAVDVRGDSWNADSSKLIAVREEPNSVSDLGPANSAWVVTVTDPAHPAKIAELPATIENAAWSRDGNSILYLAQAKHDAPPSYADLYAYTPATKTIKNLTDGFDGTIGGGEPLPLKNGEILQITEKGVTASVSKFVATTGISDGKPTTVQLPIAAVSAVRPMLRRAASSSPAAAAEPHPNCSSQHPSTKLRSRLQQLRSSPTA